MRISRWAVLLAATLVAASCGGESAPDRPAKTDPIGEWELVEGSLDDVAIDLVPGYRVTMNFAADGTVNGTASCNGYGGSWGVRDGRIEIGDIASNAAACMPVAVMTAEVSFLEAIRRPLTPIREGDRLLLSGVGVALTFEAIVPVSAAALVGTEWLLTTLLDGKTSTSAAGEPATLLLTEDGSVIGSTGCRTLSGEYVINADTIFFTTFAAGGDCPTALRDQDAHVVEALGDGFTTVVEGATLTVSSSGTIGLQYTAAP